MKNQTITQALSVKIREYIELHGMRQVEFAGKVGLGQSAISMLLNGKTEISIRNIEKICTLIGISWQDLASQIEKLGSDDTRLRALERELGKLDGAPQELLDIVEGVLESTVKAAQAIKPVGSKSNR